jgi:HPt (histidine-containing phosphotransfer) domain-containing protein
MSSSQKSIEDLMRPLRIQYQHDLSTRIELLEEFADQIASGSIEQDRIAEVTSIAHKLAGTGTTFGFEDISRYGKELEIILLRTGEFNNEEVSASLSQLLVACRSAQSENDNS